MERLEDNVHSSTSYKRLAIQSVKIDKDNTKACRYIKKSTTPSEVRINGIASKRLLDN